jgi:hypothetical protein
MDVTIRFGRLAHKCHTSHPKSYRSTPRNMQASRTYPEQHIVSRLVTISCCESHLPGIEPAFVPRLHISYSHNPRFL